MIYGRSLCFLALLKLVDFNLSVISLSDIINETFKILYLVSLPCRMSIGGFIRIPSMKVYRRIFFRLSILDPVTVFLTGLVILMFLSVALDIPVVEYGF